MRTLQLLKIEIFLSIAPLLYSQSSVYPPGATGGSGICTVSGAQSTGYVLTAANGVNACTWQPVGGASVDNTVLKNAWYLADSGTANHVVGTTTTTFPGSYANGQALIVKVAATNTGAVDINVASVGVVGVTKGGAALAAGNLVANHIYLFTYNSTTSTWDVIGFTLVAADIPTPVSTATALAANGTNCATGAAAGVDASGNAEGCANYTADPAGNGFVSRTALGTAVARSITSATLTITNGNGVSGNTTVECPTANGSTFGCISAADWTTFNGKQAALTNPITGTGTTKPAVFTGAHTIGDAAASDIFGLWSGTKDSAHCLAGDGTMQSCAGGGGGGVTDPGSNGFMSRTALNSTVARTITSSTLTVTNGNGVSANPTVECPTASGSLFGCLTSADWTTFNNKQAALTNPVTGTGTTNTLPIFTGASALGNSNLSQNADGANTAGKALTWASAYKPTFGSGSTTTCDLSQSNLCEVDFGSGNTTLAFTNPHGAGPYLLRSCEDGVGSRSYTFDATMKGFVQPDPAATVCTEQPFTYDGTNYQGGSSAVPNSSWHGESCPEGTAPAGATGFDFLYCLASSHRWVVNMNNGGAVQLVVSGGDINTSDQVTNGSHITNSSIPNTGLVNPSFTIAGHSISLGGTQAIAAADLSNGTTGSNGVVLATSPTIVTPTIASFVNATHNHQAAAGGGTLTEAALALTDITTNNTSTSNHGFAPKLDNVVTHFLNGQGGWTVPPGGGSGCVPAGSAGQILEDTGIGTCSSISLGAVNPQTTTYQVLAADFTSYKTVTVASGTFTVTLVASGSQPPNGQAIRIINYGSGVVTLARSGQNLNGGTASLTIPAASATGPTGAIVVSNGTDYFAGLLGTATMGGDVTGTTGSSTIAANAVSSSKMAVVNTRRTCVIDNDTQSATALTAAQFSGHCTIPAAGTIVEVDVIGGTGTLTGSAAAPTVTGTGSIQIGKYTPNGGASTTGLLSGLLAAASGKACAMTSTSGTCINGNTSSGTITISTTALAAGDVVYVSAASADAAQTWYQVTVIYTVN